MRSDEVGSMSESESDSQVQWLDDPPATWEEAPDSPPTPDTGGAAVTASRAGGLLLREVGSGSRFLFDIDPIDVRP